jgi:hypothetical protein
MSAIRRIAGSSRASPQVRKVPKPEALLIGSATTCDPLRSLNGNIAGFAGPSPSRCSLKCAPAGGLDQESSSPFLAFLEAAQAPVLTVEFDEVEGNEDHRSSQAAYVAFKIAYRLIKSSVISSPRARRTRAHACSDDDVPDEVQRANRPDHGRASQRNVDRPMSRSVFPAPIRLNA